MAKKVLFEGCMADCCRDRCHCGASLQWYDGEAASPVTVEPSSEWEEFAWEFNAHPEHFGCALRDAIRFTPKLLSTNYVVADMWAFNYRCAA